MRKALTALAVVCGISCAGQDGANMKFGKINAADLQKKSYVIDTGAVAVVIADIGSTQIKGNKKEWFSLEFKRHRRIHILNKNGYGFATVEIPLYADGEMEEELNDLRAVTYNYENGKVTETKLDVKSSLFKDRLSKNRVIRKFTFPNVKEGSVIEYEYKITSDFLFNLQPWYFQEPVPVLWSEYTVSLPQFMNYVLIGQGYHPFHLRDQKSKYGTYTVEVKNKDSYGTTVGSERVNISCGITDFRWAMKDIPAMKEEAYTTTIANYISKLEFQLAGYQEPLTPEKVMTTWDDLTRRLLKREDFGQQLQPSGTWLADAVSAVLKNTSSETEKAKAIYSYIRDNFTCTGHYQLYTDKSLKTVYEKKNGAVAEINLLLTAMLRQAGLNADPVILSRRPHGFIYPKYPVIGRFNYVISRAMVEGKMMLLDASHSGLGFGKLNYDCYNGPAKVVNEVATEISLLSDQLTEKETVVVSLAADAGGNWTGKIDKLYGEYGSAEIRQKLKGNGQEAFLKELAGKYDNDVKLANFTAEPLGTPELPVTVKYDISYSSEQADIVYVNPVITDRYKQNPFKSDDRKYPVEMPFKLDETYSMMLTVPAGYVVDETPQSLALKMNKEGDAAFEYAVSRPSADVLKVQCRLTVNKTTFDTNEYDALREFFNRVVAKQNEQVVLKKKK